MIVQYSTASRYETRYYLLHYPDTYLGPLYKCIGYSDILHSTIKCAHHLIDALLQCSHEDFLRTRSSPLPQRVLRPPPRRRRRRVHSLIMDRCSTPIIMIYPNRSTNSMLRVAARLCTVVSRAVLKNTLYSSRAPVELKTGCPTTGNWTKHVPGT